MSLDIFECKECGREFESTWPVEEAVKVRDELFPGITEFETVCEGCFIATMEHNEPGEGRYLPYVDKDKPI